MKNKKISIDLDIEDLLGLKEDKNSLEYDLNFIINNGEEDFLKHYLEHEEKKKEFIQLFKECYNDIVKIIELDPKQQIAVNCLGCRYSGRLDLSKQYAKPKKH